MIPKQPCLFVSLLLIYYHLLVIEYRTLYLQAGNDFPNEIPLKGV